MAEFQTTPNTDVQSSQNKSSRLWIILIILIIIILVAIVVIIFLKLKSAEESANSEEPYGDAEMLKSMENYPKELYRDFGMLKYLSNHSESEKEFLETPIRPHLYVPESFGDDINNSLGIVYSPSADIIDPPDASDAVRTVIQTYNSPKSYEALKNNLFEQFNGSYQTTVNETFSSNKKYICTIKIEEGVRCLWVSNNKVIFLLIELSQDNIKNTPGLEDSWNQLKEFYLDYFPPTYT